VFLAGVVVAVVSVDAVVVVVWGADGMHISVQSFRGIMPRQPRGYCMLDTAVFVVVLFKGIGILETQ